MAPIHIVQVIDSLKIGGAEMLLRELTQGLLDRNFRVTVCYNTAGPLVDSFNAMDIELFHFPSKARINPFLITQLSGVMKRGKPQLVHTHLFKSDFHGRLAARLSGVPVVISTLHNNDVWARRFPLGQIYGATARFTDALIAVSQEVRQYHLQYTGIPAEKIVTIENGVDLSRFSTIDTMPGENFRKEFNIDSKAPLFGIIGRLVPQKDHFLFLRTAAEILKKLPLARFLIVGDGELRGAIEEEARRLSLLPALIFTGIRRDIPAILDALDVLVFSSKWEGLPVTLLEGMAASRPVVSTAVDGVRDVLQDGITGILGPAGDYYALAQACLKLANNVELRKSMGLAGRKLVSERYSIVSMIDRTVALYQKYLSEKGTGNVVLPDQSSPDGIRQ
jgi:glycosyltransferase involved in cell wall biosynthesis